MEIPSSMDTIMGNTLPHRWNGKDVRMISGLLIHLVEAEVTDGIPGAGRGHE